MLTEQINQYIQDELKNSQDMKSIKIYKEEKEFAEKHHLIPDGITIQELDPLSRFNDAYLERGDKVTADIITTETPDFLQQPIDYFKKHKNEFIYIESKWFEIIRVDAISFEVDDVFGTYDVMLGLKFQKKYGVVIKEQLRKRLETEEMTSDLMFNNQDGLWDLNFALDHVPGFKEELTLAETYGLIYSFLFKLVENVEETQV